MNHSSYFCPITLNTTRICSLNPIDTAVEVSKIGFTTTRPNAVILVNKNEIFDGIASAPLMHFPINASLLFTDGDKLSNETAAEIMRLSPKGYNGVHVILFGNISPNVSFELNMHGLITHHILGRNHYETACRVPGERKNFKNILIISGENYSEGIVAAFWSSHHGDPILFVEKDHIPLCTLEAIKKAGDINIYITGSIKTVSKSVEENLSGLPNVKHLDRISGETPYDIAVNFAKYKDSRTDFGWSRNYRDGHAFTFGTLNHPMDIIAGMLFAHMGKHTPLLLTQNNNLPDSVKTYIKSVKPLPPKDMPRPPFMHGYILGNTTNISYCTQVNIEDIISLQHEMSDMGNMGHTS